MSPTAILSRPPTLMRVYVEELRALPRGRFALAGAASLAAFVAFLAVVISATSNSGLWGFGIFVHLVLPTAFAAFSATQVSGARASRFVQPLFTTPLRKSTWLAAKVLVALTLGGLYILATLPFYAVAELHVGLSEAMKDFVLIGAGLIVFGVALGTFLGVAFTGRSVAAPVSVAILFMVTSVLAGMYSGTMLAAPEGTSAAAQRLAHLSPVVLLADATDLYEAQGYLAGDPMRSLALYALEVVGFLTLAFRIFLRHQGIEGWESGGARRSGILALAALLVVTPIAAADVDYKPIDESNTMPTMVAPETHGAAVAILPRGGDASKANFDFFGGTYERPLEVSVENEVDLLVALPVDADATLYNVTVRLEGRRGLAFVTEPNLTYEALSGLETVTVRNPMIGGPSWQGVVLRILATILPADPTDLSMNIYGIEATVTYRVNDDPAPRQGHAVLPLRADSPGATLHLALAGIPIPLVVGIAALGRRARHG